MDKAVKAINYIMDWISSIPGHSWYMLGVLVGSSIIVSTVLELILRHYRGKLDIVMGKRIIATLLGFLSLLATYADAILAHASDFLPFIGNRLGWVVSLAVLYHHFIGNVITRKVVKALAKWSEAKKAPKTEETPVEEPRDTQPLILR
jgi:hypothetical protein